VKNLILGAAIGYRPKNINTFVKSFRRYNEVDDVFLLVYKNIDDEWKTKDFLKEHNINYLVCDETYVKGASINNTRYFKYLEFLHKNEYSKVFLTDVRDVVFQKNPFDELPNDNFLFFFEEDRSEVIGNNTYTDYWITQSFGETVLSELNGNPIICSGTTFGSYKNILFYLIKMNNLLNVIKIQKPETYKIIGLDQGVHNYIAYKENELFNGFKIKENGDIVATVGITSENNPNDITIKDDVLYLKDYYPAIVHQYDRNPELEKPLNTIYN